LANAEQETLPTTPIVLPDGTVVHGLEEFGTVAAAFAGSNDFTFGPISNTFRYRPLNLATVVAYGIVEFTIDDHEHGTSYVLSNVQTELFRRNHQMPRGWEQVYEQHAYTHPLLGDLNGGDEGQSTPTPNGITSRHGGTPGAHEAQHAGRHGHTRGEPHRGAAVVGTGKASPDNYPPVDPDRVECTAFRPANDRLCYKTANALHQLFELIFDQFTVGDVANAVQETLPTTPQVFPDGTVVYGVEGFASIAARWAGSNEFTFGPTSNPFRYRPLDRNTVVAYGIVEFTINDHEDGTIRVLSSVQTELFRRNPQMPRGWEQVYEQLAYTQPLLGDRQ